MADEDGVGGISNARTARDTVDEAGVDQPAFERVDVANVSLLQDVPGGFRGVGRGPCLDGMLEADTLPPVRVVPGEMEDDLTGTSDCFADAVAGEEEAFTTGGAEVVEFELLGMWFIKEEPALVFSQELFSVLRNLAGVEFYLPHFHLSQRLTNSLHHCI